MSVRVVLAADKAASGDMTMDDAVLELARRVNARKPVVVLITWEEQDGTVDAASAPNSLQVERALTAAMHERHHPKAEEA